MEIEKQKRAILVSARSRRVQVSDGGLEPLAACDVLAMLDPSVAEHPDFHDGWGPLRVRRVPLECESPQRRTRILVTDADVGRLEEVLQPLRHEGNAEGSASLRAELSRAAIVSSRVVPPEVVTMNSDVICEDVATRVRAKVRLVYPTDGCDDGRRLSVLTPLGTALLGMTVGDILERPPIELFARRLCVREVVYQPEREGHFHL